MSQIEIYKFLKKNKGQLFTNKKLCEIFNLSDGSISNATCKLREFSEIKCTKRIKRIKNNAMKAINHYYYKDTSPTIFTKSFEEEIDNEEPQSLNTSKVGM